AAAAELDVARDHPVDEEQAEEGGIVRGAVGRLPGPGLDAVEQRHHVAARLRLVLGREALGKLRLRFEQPDPHRPAFAGFARVLHALWIPPATYAESKTRSAGSDSRFRRLCRRTC